MKFKEWLNELNERLSDLYHLEVEDICDEEIVEKLHSNGASVVDAQSYLETHYESFLNEVLSIIEFGDMF